MKLGWNLKWWPVRVWRCLLLLYPWRTPRKRNLRRRMSWRRKDIRKFSARRGGWTVSEVWPGHIESPKFFDHLVHFPSWHESWLLSCCFMMWWSMVFALSWKTLITFRRIMICCNHFFDISKYQTPTFSESYVLENESWLVSADVLWVQLWLVLLTLVLLLASVLFPVPTYLLCIMMDDDFNCRCFILTLRLFVLVSLRLPVRSCVLWPSEKVKKWRSGLLQICGF